MSASFPPAASAIGFTPVGTIAATDVQAAIAEVASEASGGGSGAASGITFTPAGSVAATDVQAAIVELDAEKQPIDSRSALFAGTTRSADWDPSITSVFDNNDLSTVVLQVPAGRWQIGFQAYVKAAAGTAVFEVDVGLTPAGTVDPFSGTFPCVAVNYAPTSNIFVYAHKIVTLGADSQIAAYIYSPDSGNVVVVKTTDPATGLFAIPI